ncbi:YlxM family DNA-binding protein [Fundicoccus sp. Sow4_D5]|uniref:YlxM family DNA-binding protein n=1 Tax=unclassified Fundicoccus TaxID=2761543 RepID=UPI003F90421E
MAIHKTLRMNQLFDFYQALLTEKQQQMLELYYEEDLSLAEIAEHYDISRQAVHDNIRRGENALEDYEAKLELLGRRTARMTIFSQLDVLEDVPEAVCTLLNQLKAIDLT